MSEQLNRWIRLVLNVDLLLPAVLVISYLIFLFIIRGTIPTADELINSFAILYANYGYEILFASAFFEALILVNFFVPGQLAIVLGIVFARTGQTELTLVVLTVVIGAVSGYLLDYLLGIYGFSSILNKLGYGGLIEKAKLQLKKFGRRGLILGFIHSNIASFLSLAAGTINMNWVSFLMLSLFSTLFWTIIWSVLVYALGDIFLLIFRKYAFLVVLLVIAGMFISRIWGKEEKNVRR